MVIHFYEDSECSHTMPGSKDSVSIGYKLHKQKRLLLYNLKELYCSFKNENDLIKIGFSIFCSLWPTCCILPSTSGSHSLRFCAIHQNAKLLTTAGRLDYQDTLKIMVCDVSDVSNKQCIMHHCEHCPGRCALVLKLQELECLAETDIVFQQWECTDRTTLATIAKPVE